MDAAGELNAFQTSLDVLMRMWYKAFEAFLNLETVETKNHVFDMVLSPIQEALITKLLK